MPSSPPPSQDNLPEALRAQLKAFRRALWKIKLTEAILSGVAGFVVSYLILFISDRFWATPKLLALALLIGGTLLSLLFTPYWIRRWIWQERHAGQLAQLIAKRFPKLGDRLLGVVELQRQENSLLHSETLKQAAVRQVAKDASSVDFTEAIPHPRHKLAIAAVLILAALVAAIAVWAPEAGVNALSRWVMPMSDVPRYTFTRLSDIPHTLYVPLGEPFHMTVRQDPLSRVKADYAYARCAGGDWLKEKLKESDDGKVVSRFTFPGIFEEQMIDIEAGDARYSVRVIPSLRPNIQELYAEVTYPEYTGRPAERLTLKTGGLYVLKGSKVRLKAQSTAPLKEAVEVSADGSKKPLAVSQSTVTFPERVMEGHEELAFSWTDVNGIGVQTPFRVRLESVEDAAPEIYLQGPGREIYLLEKESVSLSLMGTDDHGLKELGISWNGTLSNGGRKLLDGDRQIPRLETGFIFQADSLGIKPQRLTVRGTGTDYRPGREPVYSAPLTIFVLDKNEHAQMIRAGLERMATEIEELTQREQALSDETAQLLKKNQEELLSPEIREQLKELAAAEAENADRLRELLEKMDELFQKALRNDQIDAAAMRPFHDAREILGELPDHSQKQAQEALKQASRNNNTPEKTRQELEKAGEKQQQSLKEMNSALQKLSQATKNMEEGTFIARLKKASDKQREISDSIQGALPESVGLIPEELDSKIRQMLGLQTAQQKTLTRDVRWIADDLSGFFLRSKDPLHGQVSAEMQSFFLDQNMDALSVEITDNHGAIVINTAQRFAALFLKWAGMMEKAQKETSSGGGGDGSGNDDSMSESDFDFMLKVMKMIQTQLDIRSRTRAIEDERRENAPSPPAAPASPTRS